MLWARLVLEVLGMLGRAPSVQAQGVRCEGDREALERAEEALAARLLA